MSVESSIQPPAPAQLRRTITHLLLDFFKQIHSGPTLGWLDLQLTMAQLKMLSVVEWMGPAPTSHAAARLGIGVSAATGVLDRLVEQHLVMREQDPRDRRIVLVRTTGAGHALVERLQSASGERLERILDHIDDTELQRCCAALEAMTAAARAESTWAPLAVGASSNEREAETGR